MAKRSIETGPSATPLRNTQELNRLSVYSSTLLGSNSDMNTTTPIVDQRILTLKSTYPSLIASMTPDQKAAFIADVRKIPFDLMKSFIEFATPFFTSDDLSPHEKTKIPGIFSLFTEKKISFSDRDTPSTQIDLIKALAGIAPPNREPVIALAKKLFHVTLSEIQFPKMTGLHKGAILQAIANIPSHEDKNSIIDLALYMCSNLPPLSDGLQDGCGQASIVTAIIRLPVGDRVKIDSIRVCDLARTKGADRAKEITALTTHSQPEKPIRK